MCSSDNPCERQARAPQDLTQGMLHGLRTQLSHIRHNAELVHAGKADVKRSMEAIAEACDTLLGIVNVNSEISANYAEADETPAEDVNLSAVVGVLADMYSSVAEVKRIGFAVALPEKPIFLSGHKYKFQRLIANLLDNAFKFTPEGGSVKLSAAIAFQDVVITVSDTGSGISREDREHIYERFYRSASAKATSGNGLGLSLVHSIVTYYRGGISCTSAPGQGTTFTVRLPVPPCATDD